MLRGGFRSRAGRLLQATVAGAFAVGPAEQAAGDEPVDALAARHPQARGQPRRFEDAPFALRELLRAVGPLVLEQVPQVLARQQPEQAATAPRVPGELEIDERGL